MHAARNVMLCTKDCLCLFVCPTGATDTENGQIDFEKCLDGCRLCVDACPSHALYLVYDSYAKKPDKRVEVKDTLTALLESMSEEKDHARILTESDDPKIQRMAKAISASLMILSEDCTRESGFLLPQSDRVRDMLDVMAENDDPQFPHESVEQLKKMLG